MGLFLWFLFGLILANVRTYLHIKYYHLLMEDQFDANALRVVFFILYLLIFPLGIFVDLAITSYLLVVKKYEE